MTAIELVVAMAVLAVAFAMYSNAVIALVRHRQMLRESAVAADACQNVMETMRSEPLAAIYALYNHNTADDPNGTATAPGNHFQVLGLDGAVIDAGAAGAIRFPEVEIAPGTWQLREDLDDSELGMPRDLNGDSMIDDKDHSADYVHLPTIVQVHWKGTFGSRRFELVGLCTEFRR